jgi:hypothetical protein
VLIQVLILVSCFGVEEAATNRGLTPSKSAGPSAAVASEEDVVAQTDKEFNKHFASLRKLQDAQVAIAVDAAGLRRKFRQMEHKVQETPRGDERSAMEEELSRLRDQTDAANKAEDKGEERIARAKEDLSAFVKASESKSSQITAKATNEQKKFHTKLHIEQQSLDEAKAGVKAAIDQMETHAKVPEKANMDTQATLYAVEGKATEQARDVRATKNQVRMLTNRLANAQASKIAARLKSNLRRAKKNLDKKNKLLEKTNQALDMLNKDVEKNRKDAQGHDDTCTKALAKVRAKCFDSARETVEQEDIAGSLLKSEQKTPASEVTDLGDTLSPVARNRMAKLASKCRQNADKELASCEKQLKLQNDAKESITQAQAGIVDAGKQITSAKKLADLVKTHSETAAHAVKQAVQHRPSPSGIFVSDHTVYFVNGVGQKQLVRFPTLACGKATPGISVLAFDDVKGDQYYMDEDQSRKACIGPSYANTADLSVWTDCECSGSTNKEKQGNTCSVWEEGTPRWCFVDAGCQHPNARKATTEEADFPAGQKKLSLCTEEENTGSS